jgi:hypothetical protein
MLYVLPFTAFDYPFGIFWPLSCMSFFYLRLQITPLVSFGHCIVCPFIYGFRLPIWFFKLFLSKVYPFAMTAQPSHYGRAFLGIMQMYIFKNIIIHTSSMWSLLVNTMKEFLFVNQSHLLKQSVHDSR